MDLENRQRFLSRVLPLQGTVVEIKTLVSTTETTLREVHNTHVLYFKVRFRVTDKVDGEWGSAKVR